MRLVALLPVLAVLPGCTVTALDAGDDPRPRNTCDGESDCASGICRAGVCQEPNGDLEALLLELTPPSDSLLPHLSLVTHHDEVPTAGGDMTFAITRPARVSGGLGTLPKSECYPVWPREGEGNLPMAPDGSLPLSVRLSPRERLLGLPQQLYLTTTTGSEIDFSYKFDLQVPVGEYDVYFVPPRGQTECIVPPQLYRAQKIDKDLVFDFRVPASSNVTLANVCSGQKLENTVCLNIRWPKFGVSLEGWVADIIEPLGGLPISTEFVLAEPTDETQTDQHYQVPLVYSTVKLGVDQDEETVAPLVRLRPGPGVVGPTILFDRGGLGLFKTQQADLDDFTKLPKPVRVEGQMARHDDGTPVSGHVTLVSTVIFGVNTGVPATFQTTVMVGDDGVFQVDMPPGKYQVHAVPPMLDDLDQEERALSALLTTWDVPEDVPVQYGKLLELQAISRIAGQSPVPGAEVQVQASPQPVSQLEEAFGATAFAPRAASGLVDDRGRFRVLVDPGTFDVSVRAPEELGYAWSVRPGVKVAGTSYDLGHVSPQAPVVVTGIAQVSGGSGMATAVPLALLRAYAYLDASGAYTREPSLAGSVVQVAEARTDENGAFRLLLPSSIAKP